MVRQKIKFIEEMTLNFGLKRLPYSITNLRKTVFLILKYSHVDTFFQSFILAANHVFHITRILRKIKVELFYPS